MKLKDWYNTLKENKRLAVGVTMIFLALVILVINLFGFITGKTKKETTVETQAETKYDYSQYAAAESSIASTETETQLSKDYGYNSLDYTFQIYELPDTAYDLMETTQEDLSKALKDWTYYNGYSTARSAAFYPTITIELLKNNYKMQLQLDDDSHSILTMEYNKDSKIFTFHL